MSERIERQDESKLVLQEEEEEVVVVEEEEEMSSVVRVLTCKLLYFRSSQ